MRERKTERKRDRERERDGDRERETERELGDTAEGGGLGRDTATQARKHAKTRYDIIEVSWRALLLGGFAEERISSVGRAEQEQTDRTGDRVWTSRPADAC